MFQKIFKTRFKALAVVYVVLASISLFTRFILFAKSYTQLDMDVFQFFGIFVIGLFNDTLMSFYLLLPMALYLWLIPTKLYAKKWHQFVLYALAIVTYFLLLLNAVSEWFFWDEFSTRYNFIAVDYLIYTTEVLGNIWQSYPIVKLLIAIFVFSIALFFFTKKYLTNVEEVNFRFKQRTLVASLVLVLTLGVFFFGSNKTKNFTKNQYASELSGNGLYDFGAAFINNKLDYEQFYKTESNEVVFSILKNQLKQDNNSFESNELTNVKRLIEYKGAPKKYNVVLISIESFSADFMEAFGNQQHITPRLDSLAKKSLFFTNLYASGTRTVRGLEALSLSIPPTPGQSEVKRPNNENRFSLGSVLKSKGYTTQYIYGGYGYFDNMNYFFGNNGYQVIDREAITDPKDIHYENIWGVADEDLFTLSIKNLDANYKLNKPFFSHIMTTSNHRPFTYPEGRIDIPSHTNREGAVKYTDYAIGQFIDKCKTKPWFENTIFVIVADHCASSAGKTELPIKNYKIPLFIYAPAIVKPQIFNGLTAQIDIIPTIMGLLNESYSSKFFGFDILNTPAHQRRAFISTYQKLGYLKNNQLVILSPNKKVETFDVDSTTLNTKPTKNNPTLVKEAIANYQTASYLLKNNLYQFEK